MYSRHKAAERLDLLNPIFQQTIAPYLKPGDSPKKFNLTPHSIKDVEQANAHLHSLYVPEHNALIRPLTAEELIWIENEKAICMADAVYWLGRYSWIQNWRNAMVRFSPYVAQKIIISLLAELEDQGRSLEFIILKARQLGISTVIELLISHRIQFYPYVKGVVASSDPEKSAGMAQMMETCWAWQPWWLMPQRTRRRAGEYVEFGIHRSSVTIHHGTQHAGIARGSTPTVAHLSELLDFDNPEELVDSSLLRAMHPNPWLLLFLESTARGRHNWWHKTWVHSNTNWEDGNARLRPVFLPWFIGTDIYPTKTDLLRFQRDKYRPSDLVLKHAGKAQEYVRDTEILRQNLGPGWQMPIEQMWYWDTTRREYADKGILANFYQEMPASADEAFQSSNTSIFTPELIYEVRGSVRRPHGIYGVVGPQNEIPLRMQPSRKDVDPDVQPITVRAKWAMTGRGYEYQLIPLKVRNYPNEFDPHGKLILWELPKDDFEYGIGVDTSEGVGLDATLIEVVRKGTLTKNDAQVAEWASPDVGSLDLWPIAMAVGTLYSTKVREKVRQARIVVECRGTGESVQHELQKRGWRNFHPWLRLDRKQINEGKAKVIGWFTNSWSRPMMLDYLIKALKDGWLEPNSPWLVDEMEDLEYDEVRQKLKAARGCHDDRIMAIGIALFSIHVLDVRGVRMGIASLTAARDKDKVNLYARYTPGVQGLDIDPEGFEMPLVKYADKLGDDNEMVPRGAGTELVLDQYMRKRLSF